MGPCSDIWVVIRALEHRANEAQPDRQNVQARLSPAERDELDNAATVVVLVAELRNWAMALRNASAAVYHALNERSAAG